MKIFTSNSLLLLLQNLKTKLDGKSDTNHTHSISNITNLQNILDSKAASSHTHSAYVNQNAFSNVVVGSTTVAADSATDTLTLVAGSNVTLTPDATNDKITISATDTKYSAATTSAAGLMSKDDKTKLDGITASADAVSFSRSLTSGTKVGTITINGTGTDLYAPTNTDTHYTTGLKVGASNTATANAAATNGNVYLNALDNTTVRDSHKIVGTGATTVTSDANGVITISSTDNNTWRGIQNNLTSDSTTDSLSAAQGKALKTLVDGKSDTSHTHNYAGSSSAGGAANSATKLATARTIGLGTGVTSTATSFDGSSNITIPVNSIKESYLTWGGKNFSGSYGCIDAAMVSDLGANRLMFGKAAGITIQYSTNGGSTWTDYGASDSAKVGLFSSGYGFTIGKATKDTITTNCMLRVIIDTDAFGVYTVLNKFVVYLSTSGSGGCYCTIDASLESSPTTFTTFADKIPVSGWSGYNVINTSGITTYRNSPSSQYGLIRFTFGCTSVNTNYSGLSVSQIMGFGGVGWNTPSTMAKTGHLYSYDSSQNATFPAKVTAASFSGALSGNASTATTATKLGASTVGGTTTPIYLNNGTPTALGYTIAKSVPSNAKFTDTTYSVATSTKDGLMSAADKKLFDYTNNQLETDLDNLLDKPAESIADIIYPVGSIYMSVNSVNPGALFGGSWEQIAQGRTLFGAGKLNGIKYTAGEEIDAGLPDPQLNLLRRQDSTSSGVYKDIYGTNGYTAAAPSNTGGTDEWMQSMKAMTAANRYMDVVVENPIYGNSTTVQPNALVVYIWKRTA